jgi:hypothetical protein
MKCDAGYITDKYDSMIGVDPTRIESQSDWWQRVILDDFKSMALKAEWFSIWSKGSFIINEKSERILNYLCEVNVSEGINLNRIIKLFNKHLGNVELISKEHYNHLHPLFIKFANDYKTKIEKEIKDYIRESNLNILTEGHTALNYQKDRGEETQPTIA